ncbi:uncharacterized protein B0T15DRAFT_257645 [Chaetomium strumarium]|uniref:Uncharacterized protein n=1 Tax=Chaetomium strumarium TaxID=1170767 RepID=A0AAJ0GMV8_9PEZI|nr:hypothetical protein B0T15DRAFT_257645 [Chaetomium strumarium]
MVVSCRHTRRRVEQACQVWRVIKATVSVSWLISSRPFSHPPTKTRSAFSIIQVVVVDVTMPTSREDYSSIVGSDAKQGKDKDIIRPPLGKRRRANTSALATCRTAPKRRICPDRRSSSIPQSSRGPALEEKIVEDAFTSFKEWPLEAVLKRVLVGGEAIFQVEYLLRGTGKLVMSCAYIP